VREFRPPLNENHTLSNFNACSVCNISITAWSCYVLTNAE
jgi:hypothetical protein